MSGVSENAVDPWLGRLSVGWSIKRLGALGTLVKGRGGSKEDNRDAGVPVVRYGDLYTKFDTTIAEPAAFVSEEDAVRYTPLPRHSIVFAASGESAEDIGKSAMSLLAEPAVVGGDAVVFHPSDKIDSLYLAYALESSPIRAYKVIRSTGFTVVHISAGKLKTLPIPFPPGAEQRAIADYLARETARIDTLVSEQQHLIELQRERRQAVIDVAFANAQTNSRIVRACLDVVDCPHTTPAVDDDGQFEAVRTASVRAGRYRPGHGLRVSEVTWRERNAGGAPCLGDILFAREGGSAGEASMVPTEDICLGQRMVLLRIDASVCVGEFLLWQLYSRRVQDYFRLSMSGAAAGNIRVATLRNTPIWLPPLETQRRIAAHLNDQTAKIDSMIVETERFIELVLERRAALITATVTGQIDVREMV